MAKQPKMPDADEAGVVDELFPVDPEVEYTEITPENDLPEGVTEEEEEPKKKVAKPRKEPKDDAPAPANDEGDELRGKSPEEIARMYRDAQSLIGRQGRELGELRRTHDDVIKRSLSALAAREQPVKPQPAVEKDPDDIDFLTDPKAMVAKAVENHPALKSLKDENRRLVAEHIARTRMDNARQFQADHPDAAEVLQDQAFKDWVTNSRVRLALYQRAHEHYDLDAANELFNTWKELKTLRNPKPVESEAAPAKPVARKPAKVPTGGSASPQQTGGKSQRFYKRSEVVRMMEEQPERYREMADEITRAYIEGRVR